MMRAKASNRKVLILGATGLLGSNVYSVLKDRYSLVLSARNRRLVDTLVRTYGWEDCHRVVEFDVARLRDDFMVGKGHTSGSFSGFLEEVGGVDYVVNAIGMTVVASRNDPGFAFFLNGAFPHILARAFGKKLIHITTDCVYDGVDGFPYDENSIKNPVDIYGLTKSLGEPDNGLTIRTSIVGRELGGQAGLLEWFLHQEGKIVKGFAEHRWNGVTARQFGRICDVLIQNPEKFPASGIYHVFSTTVSKYEMLLKFREKFGVKCTVVEDHSSRCNRTLSTVKTLNRVLNMPTFDEMLGDL